MNRIMNDGKPLSWHLYPPFPWRGATRKRVFSYLTTPTRERPGKLIDELGNHFDVENDIHIYDALKAHAMGTGRVIYTPKINLGVGKYSLLLRAANDPHAEISYHPKGGIRGIRFKYRSAHMKGGSIMLDRVWYKENQDIYDWLGTLRKTADIIAVGDYETAGAFGQATLSRFWTQHKLRKVWRLAEDLADMLEHFSVGGRAEIRGESALVYANAWEIDLSSAYPTAVARGLPVGDYVYHARGATWNDREALFGLWRITIHDDIQFSPIPVRDWRAHAGPIGWSLDEGWEFEYAGWEDEIKALVATGHASAEFIRGWSWWRLSDFLAPWVDEMVVLRSRASDSQDHEVAKHIKMVTNAAIGRWGMSNDQWAIVTDPMSRTELGDLPLEYDPGTTTDDYMGELSGLWVRPLAEQSRNTLPYHWSSYVKMVVRMELYRRAMQEMQYGGTLLSTNFDSILMADRPQGSNELDIAVAQSEHPWVWKAEKAGQVQLPFNRGFIFRLEDGQLKVSLPGVSGAKRRQMIEEFLERSESA